jgi:transmembrane sensor
MAGAALTAAAAVALVFWLVQPSRQFGNIATPAAQRQTLTLADGTKVDLNAQTNIQIEIDGRGRKVRLASGEAFFAVHKDPSRPFIVETPTGSVRVTGTKFDVRTENADVLEVTVLEGSVQTHPGDSNGRHTTPILLKAGDTLLTSSGKLQRRNLSDAEVDDALAWRQGQVVLKDMPLREVLALFARYHGLGIAATPEVAELSVGGRFSLDDLEGFFGSLETALPVKVVRNLNGTVQVVHRSGR